MLIEEKQLFSKEECDLILNLIKTNQQNWNSKDRKYNSQTISYYEKNSWIFDKLQSFVEIKIGIKFRKIKKQIHFHRFVKGDWFGKHNDNKSERLYAVGVLLNDDFEGGDFILYNPNEHMLNKKIGNTYIFDVRIEHEITPILEGERYSLLWFLQKEHIEIKRKVKII